MSPLMKAVSTGNIMRVEKLLAQGADVLEVQPQTQETLLMMAVNNPGILATFKIQKAVAKRFSYTSLAGCFRFLRKPFQNAPQHE